MIDVPVLQKYVPVMLLDSNAPADRWVKERVQHVCGTYLVHAEDKSVGYYCSTCDKTGWLQDSGISTPGW